MGTFYIETSPSSVASGQKVIYELSATTDITIKKGSKITSYPIQSGRQFVDNIVVDDGSISISGIITDVSFSDASTYAASDGSQLKGTGAELVEKYIEQIKSRIDNREVFTFYFSSVLKPLNDCVITNFTYSKDNTLGNESWKITIDAQPIRFGKRAQYVVEPAVAWESLTAPKKQGSGNKSTVSEKSEEEILFTTCKGAQKWRGGGVVGNCKMPAGYPGPPYYEYDQWLKAKNKYFADKKKTVKKGTK